MELDLHSLFGLHVHSCTYWLRPRILPPSSRILTQIRGRYWSAKIDDISCDLLEKTICNAVNGLLLFLQVL
jgi:hypothetical protein